jgi:hypothetical protein
MGSLWLHLSLLDSVCPLRLGARLYRYPKRYGLGLCVRFLSPFPASMLARGVPTFTFFDQLPKTGALF